MRDKIIDTGDMFAELSVRTAVVEDVAFTIVEPAMSDDIDIDDIDITESPVYGVIGVGTSKRNETDEHDPKVAFALTYGRALQDYGKEVERAGYRRANKIAKERRAAEAKAFLDSVVQEQVAEADATEVDVTKAWNPDAVTVKDLGDDGFEVIEIPTSVLPAFLGGMSVPSIEEQLSSFDPRGDYPAYHDGHYTEYGNPDAGFVTSSARRSLIQRFKALVS